MMSWVMMNSINNTTDRAKIGIFNYRSLMRPFEHCTTIGIGKMKELTVTYVDTNLPISYLYILIINPNNNRISKNSKSLNNWIMFFGHLFRLLHQSIHGKNRCRQKIDSLHPANSSMRSWWKQHSIPFQSRSRLW